MEHSSGAASFDRRLRAHAGIPNLLVPADNAAEAAVADGVRVFAMRHLTEVVRFLAEAGDFTPHSNPKRPRRRRRSDSRFHRCSRPDDGQRAFEVAAAGGHNVLMVGPPGSGNDARPADRRHPAAIDLRGSGSRPPKFTALPASSAECRIAERRPFRSPHHSVRRQV